MKIRSPDTWLAALPWLAVALASAPLLRGFPRGHDWSFELVRVAEYGRAFAGGQWPPAWAENLYGGYGSPIFLFYAPLYAAVSSLFGAWVGSVPTGALLAIVAFGVVGTAAMLRMGRLAAGADDATAREAGRVAACLFVLHPYLICDALLRNANAEYAALCIAPIAVTGLLELRRDRVRGALWLSGGLALLILAHNLTALFFAGAIVVAAAALYASRRTLWLPLGGGLALGLAMAVFFWLPALALTSLVRPEDLLTGKFDFHTQFPAVSEIFAYAPFFGAGVLPLAVLGAGFVFAVRRIPQQRLLVVSLVGAATPLLLMLAPSAPVWEVVPGLPFFQFPWRMQGPLALFTAGVGAVAYGAWAKDRSLAWRRAAQVAVLVLAAANAAPHLLAVRSFPPELRAELGPAFTSQSVKLGANMATVRDEYLPRTAAVGTWKSQPMQTGGFVSFEGGGISGSQVSGTHVRMTAHARRPATLRLARWVFPGWSLSVDGVPIPLEPNRFGSVDVAVPEGAHEVDLRFRPPLVRRAGLFVSGASFLLWIGLLVRTPLIRSRRPA